MNKTLISVALATLVAGAGFAPSASAASVSGNFQVKLAIAKTCAVSTSGVLDLGSVNAGSTADVSQNASNINVTCSKATAYTVGLKPSSNSTDGTGTMAGATSGNTDTVAYALYQDAASATTWGTATTKAGVGNGTTQNYTVYGKVLGTNLNVTPDSYADTVSVTVTY